MITAIKAISPNGGVREYPKGRYIFVNSSAYEIYTEKGGLILAIVPLSWAVEYVRE